MSAPLHSVLVPAADQAQAILGIWRLMLWICVPMYLLVLAAVAVVIRRVQRTTRNTTPAAPSERVLDRGLVAWVALMLIGLIVLALGSFLVDRDLIARPHGDVNLRITAHQWWWEIEYLGDDPVQHFTTANELHLPLGKLAHIELASADVIHSFWVPSLSGKRDLIPGRTNFIDLTPRQAGAFRGQCAEFCGLQHAHMALTVFVDAPDAFEAWRSQQRAERRAPMGETAQRGEQLLVSGTCAMCHSVRGTTAASKAGPDLTHLASRSTLAAGALPFGKGPLAAWLADPQGIKPGCNMPDIDLEPDQLDALATYLSALQ